MFKHNSISAVIYIPRHKLALHLCQNRDIFDAAQLIMLKHNSIYV